jgi:hypothetical protein
LPELRSYPAAGAFPCGGFCLNRSVKVERRTSMVKMDSITILLSIVKQNCDDAAIENINLCGRAAISLQKDKKHSYGFP